MPRRWSSRSRAGLAIEGRDRDSSAFEDFICEHMATHTVEELVTKWMRHRPKQPTARFLKVCCVGANLPPEYSDLLDKLEESERTRLCSCMTRSPKRPPDDPGQYARFL